MLIRINDLIFWLENSKSELIIKVEKRIQQGNIQSVMYNRI